MLTRESPLNIAIYKNVGKHFGQGLSGCIYIYISFHVLPLGEKHYILFLYSTLMSKLHLHPNDDAFRSI